MMKSSLIVVVVIIIALAGASILVFRSSNGTGSENIPPPGENENVDGFRVFNMTAKQFEFIPSTITVDRGDNVRLQVTSADVAHGIAIAAFGIDETLPPGQKVTVEFFAENAGTFPFECSIYCGSGHSGMTGQIVVQ